jgi:mannitol/fructose-specific phosphotransferase system IIA component (Ntr-type)
LSHFFFIILAPPDQSGPHIEALAEIAKMTRFDSFFTSLIEATSPKEIVSLFKEE